MPVDHCPVTIYAGTFDSQPLVFAHLIDVEPGLDLDHVEVICGVDPVLRLGHALEPNDAQNVEDSLALDTTVVLIFDAAVPEAARLPSVTARLRQIGRCTGRRHRPAL